MEEKGDRSNLISRRRKKEKRKKREKHADGGKQKSTVR